MKLRCTLAVTLLCPVFLMAQPIITRDWVGTPGDEISVLFTTDVPDAGPDGANASWDFSSVSPDTTQFDYLYVDPDTTPFFNSYPNSNLCQFLPDLGIYSYYKIDNTSWEFLGSAFGMFLNIFQNPKTTLIFPMNFEDSFTDDFSSTTSFFGVTTFGTGNVQVTADAYGTLTLPTGTFDDVMRIKLIDEAVDSTDLGLGIVEKIHKTNITYIWLSSVHPGALCTRNVTESFQVALVPPLPPDTLIRDPDSIFFYDPTATSSAVPYFTNNAFELEVTPNPFVHNLNLNFTVDKGQDLKFEMQTINGQVIYSEDISSAPGYNNFVINVQRVPAGSYIAILRGEEEGSIRRLVKIE
jgi:hypothetical protein